MKYIIIGLIILLSVNSVSATDLTYEANTLYHISIDNDGQPSYSNTWYLTMNTTGSVLTWGYLSCVIPNSDAAYNYMKVYKEGATYWNNTGRCIDEFACLACFDSKTIMTLGRYNKDVMLYQCGDRFYDSSYPSRVCRSSGGNQYVYGCDGKKYNKDERQILYMACYEVTSSQHNILNIYNYLKPDSLPITISGDINTSVNEVIKLYVNISGTEYLIRTAQQGSATECNFNVYSFDVITGMDYRLNSSLHGDSYPDPQSEDRYILNLLDDCGNLLINPTTTIFRNMTEIVYEGNDNPIDLAVGIDVEVNDYLQIIIDTHDMAVQYLDYVEIIEKDLYHNNVDWELQTFVYDNFTSNAIESAKVSINQTCRIDDYPTYTYGLTNDYGFVTSYQLSNQNFTIECTKSGYKDYYGEFTADFDAWNGTYYIEIYLDNTTSEEGYDGNETLPDTPCSTAWSNNDNLIISEINDTEDTRLHYMAGSSTTLLYLERWSESTQLWMIEGSSITLDPYEIGYIQYTSANWTEDETTIYRGRLWSLNCYCDDTSTLKVWNSTDGNETTYDNLTVSIRFLSKIGGHYVNPNAPIQIKAYAASNNTSLLTIDLQLYNESTKVDNLSLTFFDWYVDNQFKVYKWNPNYDYVDGFNYTVKMIGFNGALLAIDHVYTNASGDSPYNTNNELTVFVKDNYNQQIPYATIFIEDWGSIATGAHNYATVTGLPDGDYQYKATKSGYISSGWATITLTEHESATCILIALEETSVIGQKMSDEDIKSMFIPMMYILFIFMLLGAFMYANR